MTPTSSKVKSNPVKEVRIKALLLIQPALDPPSISIKVGMGEPKVKSMVPHESGAFVTTELDRCYIIPFGNIRHMELE